ncbi:Vacuolar protein sorting-associated protein 8 [Rhizoclosmatium hyalinum]|nr:Vacuolar protein sorting-associated protein 8 [Rhizoclosmatium hyalinum]
MADMFDVAAGAAWAEAVLSSDDDNDNESLLPATQSAKTRAKTKIVSEESDESSAATTASLSLSLSLNQHQHQPALPPSDSHSHNEHGVLLLSNDSALSSAASAPHSAQLDANQPAIPVATSIASLESRLKQITIDEDTLVLASQFTIESTISKLSSLRVNVLDWWEEKRRSVSSRESVSSNQHTIQEHPAISNELYYRMKDLLDRIEFEISLCEQFRGTNAEFLRVENILNDDDSTSISSNVMSTTESIYSEHAIDRPSLSRPMPTYIPSPSSISSATSSSIQQPHPIPSQLRQRMSSTLVPIEKRNSRTSSIISNTVPTFKNGTAAAALHGNRTNGTFGGGISETNDVFKWTLLGTLSKDLFSNSTIQKFGSPTVFTVAGVIAIGTSRSMILVYELSQNMKVVLGDLATATDFGAVTSLAISLDHSKIASGYACGAIILWDIVQKKALKTILPLARNTANTEGEEDTGPKRGHLKNAKIVHLAFVGSKNDLISADNEGSAFYHSITNMMILSSITSTQLAGNQPIYSMLPLPRAQKSHPTDTARIVAVITPFRLSLMRLRPTPSVFHKFSLQKTQSSDSRNGFTCASLAWRPSLTSGNTMTSPALVCTFGKHVTIYLLLEAQVPQTDVERGPNSGKPEFEVREVGTWKSDEKIVASHWINFNVVGFLTSQENVIVFDVSRMRELERCSVKTKSILFHNVFSKELEKVGVKPEMAYFHNFRSYKGRLFILGLNSMEVAGLLNWNDRLTNLVKSGSYKQAIEMASGFYDGSALNAVSGLPTEPEAREQVVGAFLAQIISTYVSMTLSNTDFEMSSHDFAFVRDLASTSFKTCLMIHDEELLFGEIYEYFSESGVSHFFLDELEDYVLKERLSVKLNRPGIIQELVTYFSSQGWFTRLEQLIVHMDPSTMDINQILRLCQEHGMYSALIFVYNNSVKDYVTPLVCLLTPIDDAIQSGSLEDFKSISNAGYILFVYLAYIFTGKSFPVGTLTRRESLQAKSDIYNFLFSTTHSTWPPDAPGNPTTSSNYHELGRIPYPYVRLLLQYDAKEFFNVLSLAFEDSSLDGDIRIRDGHAQDGRVRFADLHSAINRQYIVDTLLMISLTEVPNDMYILNPSDLVLLNVFISKAYGRYGSVEVAGDSGKMAAAIVNGSVGTPPAVSMSSQTCKDIFQSLLTSGDESSREERQNALLSLLNVYNPARTNAERDAVLSMCQRVSFWKVAERLYKQAGEYDMVIQCYLQDVGRRSEVFNCLSELLLGGELEYSATCTLRQHVLDILVQLIHVDGVQTAALVINVFTDENEHIIDRLGAEPQSLYLYLKGLLEYETRLAEEVRGLPTNGRRGSLVVGRILRPKASQATLKGGNQSQYFTTELYNLFIRLMIQHEPASVLPFLINTAQNCASQEQKCDPYDFETVLQLCLESDSKSSALWMLERNGQISRALDIVLRDLGELVSSAMAIVKDDDDGHQQSHRSRSPSPGLDLMANNPFAARSEAMNRKRLDLSICIQSMKAEFETGLALCQRRAGSLDKWECDSLWFRLLDSILEQHNNLRLFVGTPYYDPVESDGSRTPTAAPGDSIALLLMNAFRSLLRDVISSMVIYIKLPSLLAHLLNSMSHARFGELRRNIFIMLEAYSFDSQLFTTAYRILAKDTHELNSRLVKHKHKALRPMKGQCGVCRRLLHIDTAGEREEELSDKFVVFECRHVFHERCLHSEIESKNPDLPSVIQEDYWCVVCDALNENDVRSFKRGVMDRLKGGKGKRVVGAVNQIVQSPVQERPPIDLDKLYSILDRLPTPVSLKWFLITKSKYLPTE